MNNVVTKVRIDGDDIFIKQGPLFGWAYAVNTDSEEAYHYLFDCDLIRLKLLESKNWPEDLPVSFKSELTYQLYKRRREEKETGGEPKTLQQFMAKCDLFKNENAILSLWMYSELSAFDKTKPPCNLSWSIIRFSFRIGRFLD